MNRSRVESVHELNRYNYNAPQFGGIQGLDGVETEAMAGCAVGIISGFKQLLLEELRGTKSGVGWGGVRGSAMGWGYGECAHNCAPHMLFLCKNVRRT